MSRKWERVRLGDLSVLITKGTTPTSLGYRFTDEGINFVKSESVTFDGWIDRSKFARIDAETHGALKRSQLQAGDILFSMAGVNIGKTAVVPEDILPANTNQACGIIRLDQVRAQPRFIDYHLRNPSYNLFLNNLVSQSAQPNLNLSEIRNLPIDLPPLSEQKRIAHILGTLDDKIELNRRMNATLEAMARALFQSWFVDFDPVRRNAEHATPCPEDSRFPDSFEDSELEEIPAGWNVVTLGDVLDVLETGRRPKGGVAAYKSGVPSIGAESIWGIGQFDYSKTKFIPTEFYEKTSAGRVEHEDVLLYKDGGKPGEFKPRVGLFGHGFPFEKFCINEHVFRMRSKSVGQAYLYFAISDQKVLADFANKGGKAAIPGINQVDVRSTKILRPEYQVLASFNQQVTPWCDLIIKNSIQSRTLSNLRDALLPKLLSGEAKLADLTPAIL